MTFPDDCPAVVTDTAVGHCSCTGVLPLTSGEQIQLRCISRALHVSRTELLLRSTGEWIWNTDEFEKWRSLHEHPFFLLCGSPGSGKSILTSAVIRHLEEGEKRNGEVIAFYCYDGRYESSDAVLHIMGVWLAELQARRTGDAVVARLMGDVTDLNSVHEQLSRATLRSVFQTIKHNLEEGETLILVLDGLDDVQMGHDLLQELSTLTDQHDKKHRIKIFISCRKEFATKSGIETPFQIDVDSQTSIVHDMEDYTDSILSKGLAMTCDAEMVIRIRKMTEKSQGRFLCMRLLLFILSHELASVGTNKWVLSITDDEGIKSPITIYHYMYQSIPDVHHRFTFCMLKWVLHAARPMYSWELLDVVNYELGTNYLDTDVEKSTMGLLTISRTRTVNLVHLSLRDYLTTIDWSPFPQEPYEMIARACLKALNPKTILQRVDQAWSDGSAMHIKPKPPQILGIYAEKYWIHHYLLSEAQSTYISGLFHETLREMILSGKTKPQYDSELDSKTPKTLLEIEIARLEPTSLDTINMALRIAASLGFYELAKLGLDMGATDHIISGFPENSLHLAAMGDHTRLVKLLIDYGADVNSLCKLGDTPLFHAIANGNHEVVQLLLKAGPSAAAAALAAGKMEELRLDPDISKQCSVCGQSKISFSVSF
jgi:DNA polymerase III delta prime subunit